MAGSSTISALDKVTVKDWLLALIGLLFTLAGLFIIRKDFKVGITTLAFFGPCFALFVRTILRKLRYQRFLQLTAKVAGGEPIRPSRTRVAMLGTGMLVVGIVLTLFQPNRDKILLGCGLIIAVVGGALLIILISGRLSKSYIQFDEPGITFGDAGGSATVPWSAITNVVRGEISSNPAIFLAVTAEEVMATPASHLAAIHKRMASSQSWTGADFVILSSTYGLDAPILLAAIERYMSSPAAREELRVAPKLHG